MSNDRLQKLLQFLDDSPMDPFLRYALAKEYEKLDQLPKALQTYQSLVDDTPDYIGTYYHLGKLQVKLGESEAALTTYQQGIEVAKRIGDGHAKSELMAAKMEIDEED